jgi:hypothetical protein
LARRWSHHPLSAAGSRFDEGEIAQPPCLTVMRTHGVDGALITALEQIGARSRRRLWPYCRNLAY